MKECKGSGSLKRAHGQRNTQLFFRYQGILQLPPTQAKQSCPWLNCPSGNSVILFSFEKIQQKQVELVFMPGPMI